MINKENYKKMVISIILAIIGTRCIPYIVYFDNILAYSNNVVSIIVFGLLYILFYRTIAYENIKKLKTTGPIGVLISLFLVLGMQIDKYGELKPSIATFVAIMSISTIVVAILIKLYDLLDIGENIKQKKTKKERKMG